MTAANSIQMLLCNLDCGGGTQLHAPSLPSVAHELLSALIIEKTGNMINCTL